MMTTTTNSRHVCGNCGKFWDDEDVENDEIKDFWGRVSPGEEMPSGECPDCGALTHLNRPPAMTALRALVREFNSYSGIVTVEDEEWPELSGALVLANAVLYPQQAAS